MQDFQEHLRYEYPLTPDSWVIDIGAHKGEFSRKIGAKYNCNILAFEPIDRFWKQAFVNQSIKTYVLKAGIGNMFRTELFKIQGDMTGAWASGDEGEIVTIVPIESVLHHCPEIIDLIKINVEGGEYEILESMTTWCDMGYIKNIQVQWHYLKPEHREMHGKLRVSLKETHHMTWEPALGWENWELNQ